MAYKHHRRIFVVARGAQLSGVMGLVSAQREVVVCQFRKWEDCRRRLLDTPCDVLIVDLDEAGAEPADVIAQARRIWPWQSCIALVGKGAVSRAVRVMKAGATDCIEKSAGSESLLLAIERGLRRAAALFPAGMPLTPTQLAVLHLILAGRTSRDIAERLGRSKRTVDVHRRNIFHKLGLRTSLEMMKWAMSTGFCDCERREPPAACCSGEPPGDSTTPDG